jgi:adenylate cyclase
LTSIVDAAISLSSAERGFLILGKGDETTVEVARNFAQEEVLSPEFKISRDARAARARGRRARADDQRAGGPAPRGLLASVADLQLRSVLCIPIRVRGEVVGVLYVDNRLQQHVFHEREKQLLMALADHAGTAIHNARTLEQLRSKQQELQQALDRIAR